ncbi:hypothetical protein HanIR_Chr10g0485221 [Helianthus annuus]|nr:hypothetical protein HanIR_Chr10g0485221 [Helianthus annuus]
MDCDSVMCLLVSELVSILTGIVKGVQQPHHKGGWWEVEERWDTIEDLPATCGKTTRELQELCASVTLTGGCNGGGNLEGDNYAITQHLINYKLR